MIINFREMGGAENNKWANILYFLQQSYHKSDESYKLTYIDWLKEHWNIQLKFRDSDRKDMIDLLEIDDANLTFLMLKYPTKE